MSAVQHPFVEIAVHARVRGPFAAGRALVLFSRGMEEPLWANGRGAALFGFETIYDFLDQGPAAGDLTLRQAVGAAHQLHAVGDSRSFTIRITSGFQRLPVAASCELIALADGTEGVLLNVPVTAAALKPEDCARQMLEGFDDPSTHVAVLDAQGDVISSSPSFAQLQLTPQTARMLVTLASNDRDRLIKRPIPTVYGYLPAAAAKLSDDPALLLLFIVQPESGAPAKPELASEEKIVVVVPPVADAAAPVSPGAASVNFEEALSAVADIADVDEDTIEDDAFVAEAPATEPADEADEPIAHEAPEEPVAASLMPVAQAEMHGQGESEVTHSFEDASPPVPLAVEDTTPANVSETVKAQPEKTPFGFRRDNRPTRFVWKIDAEGRFREVSAELAAAVGPHAAEVSGVAFADVAALFNLDPDGKITELLQRRDTWSGKTIWWPVEGTSMMVPIDLAALPTYTRTREFDGFRGFGIVRLADAVEDPLALGLTFCPAEETEDGEEDDAPAIENQQPSFSLDGAEDAEDEPVAILHETEEDAPSQQPEAIEGAAEAPVDRLPDDPIQPPVVEKPVLRIVETAGQRYSDKIIRFEERRGGARDTLSPVEQAAFQEIARRLDAFRQPAAVSDAPSPMTGAKAASDSTTGTLPPLDEAAPPAEEPRVEEKLTDVKAVQDVPGAPQPVNASAKADDEALAEQPADADEPSEEDESLSVAETLSQMIPLRHRPELNAEIVDQMPVALLVHVGDELIHANPEFLRLTGYGSLAALQEVGGLDALLQRQDLEDKTADAGGMVVLREDDTVVPVSARLQSIRWMGTSALILALMPTGTGTATPQKPTAAMLEEEAARADQMTRWKVEVDELRSILDTATDGVVTIDSEGDIRSMNRAASALFNFDTEEMKGKPFVVLFAHESQKSVLDYLSGLAGHGVASVLNDGREVIGREASGGFLPLFMTIGRLTSSNGYCAVIRDITQWKRTEEELRNAKRAAELANAHKSEFLAHVSHEIRTPLNAIIGFADMMATERLGQLGHPRYVEYANDIGRSGRHVLDIVNDLLDISKIEAGEMELEFVSVGLNETVAEAVSLVQPQANGQRVIIRTALSQSVPPVVADLRSIKQIVLNILSNAIRFTPSGGQIVVSTAYETNGNVVLRIRDTGIGMTRAELELAMKPFRQVAGTSRNRGDGTGLGLPLTKAMVDANRASFAIHSTPNEGTLVEVTFPSPRVLAT